MVWDSVAKDYIRLFDEVRSHVPRTIPTASSLRQPLSPTNLPTPRVDHLVQLCDDTGPAHHARYTVPDWGYGYHLDDAASTLVASTKFYNIFGDRDAARIAGVCMGLLQLLIGHDHTPAESLSYSRAQVGTARATPRWARRCGHSVMWSAAVDLLHSAAANDLVQELVSSWQPATLVGRAYGILGAANYLKRFSGASDVRRMVVALSE